MQKARSVRIRVQKTSNARQVLDEIHVTCVKFKGDKPLRILLEQEGYIVGIRCGNVPCVDASEEFMEEVNAIEGVTAARQV